MSAETKGTTATESNGTSGTPLFTATQPTIPDYPKSRLSIVNRFIDQPRPLRVAVIGGGLAGILAGILLPEKVPNIQLTIYEKNKDFTLIASSLTYSRGGTWLENVYPGVRCDIPSHVYQATFEPKTDWSDQFAPGAEIRDYWQGVARKYDVYRFARFENRVDELVWDAAASVWRVNLTDLGSGESTTEEADVVLTAIGRFNAWKLPEYPGIETYKGVLRHASDWDSSFDGANKNVAVIGNGASGIQLVANLQKQVGRLDHYARNRTWIAASWAGDERTLGPQPYSDEQKKLFAKDPQAYLTFRKELEDKYWRRFSAFFRGSPENKELRDKFTEIMRQRLAKKPELLEHIVPDFSPNCRRLTPGPGYLEAISEPNVEYIRTPIARFTETGIITTDGVERVVDAVFCATGANTDMVTPFPLRGVEGQDLRELWDPESKTGHGFPYTYLGLATPGFPNLFFVHGPHGTGPSGTVPHSVESQLALYAKILRKISSQGIRTIAPSKAAADEFVEYADAFFTSTVLSDKCSSWYNGGKPGGRVHGVWPGSAGHITAVRREPRWEDWEYTYLGESGNRFAWYFGSGWTSREADPASDMTSYLHVPGESTSLGYAPYAAGLYVNNRYGNEWLVLLGAALCGISAGVFWMAEAAIAIAYPEPWNRGKALGYWLTFRLSGQILGGAINLGLNADRNEAGKVSYTVFLVFIALQATGPFVGWFLNTPDQVERKDGKKVELKITEDPWFEIKETARLFFTKKFLLILLFIGQAVFSEAVFFTYLSSKSRFFIRYL
ncbi:hypothetical protein B0H63DRAFT_395603 [Podospora didyma]|uniref:FAD/NAD(P)-binding domain-containing protein n=1 Tax=Podospora didyma TaxID=330526 RepID=A0AAE0NQR6_9PEZI|nr:hypothetical protein B0H63DRAFT_395603 [Podospora didyma]